MGFGHPLPRSDRRVGFCQGSQSFRQGHLRIAIIVLRILRYHAFQEGASFRGSPLSQQALAEVRPRVDVLGIPFQGGAVRRLGLNEFSLLEINICQLGVVMCFVQVVDPGLQLLNAPPMVGTRKFEPAGRGGSFAKNEKKIKHRGQAKSKKDENRPNPLALPYGMHEHPKLE